MMVVLNPTYTLRVTIRDETAQGSNMQAGFQGQMSSLNPPSGRKWWDPLTDKTGCDQVLSAVKDALAKAGLQASVDFDRFELR